MHINLLRGVVEANFVKIDSNLTEKKSKLIYKYAECNAGLISEEE